jgi:Asparagine synthase
VLHLRYRGVPRLRGFGRRAVERQSDVDVDFGVFLSGGIDWSLLSAFARSLYPERPLKAYTLRSEEASYDEGSSSALNCPIIWMDVTKYEFDCSCRMTYCQWPASGFDYLSNTRKWARYAIPYRKPIRAVKKSAREEALRP